MNKKYEKNYLQLKNFQKNRKIQGKFCIAKTFRTLKFQGSFFTRFLKAAEIANLGIVFAYNIFGSQ